MNDKMMIDLSAFLENFKLIFPSLEKENPWIITRNLQSILKERINSLGDEYTVNNHVAIHTSACVEENVILKGPIIISKNCFIGAHAYLRGGVFMDENVSIGPGCEVKSSVLLANCALAHFNFVGDSLIGSRVNLEAGAIIANHYNERMQKMISVLVNEKCLPSGVEKFGALVGDDTKIGANAVLSPGTILKPHSIVKRLELVDQCK